MKKSVLKRSIIVSIIVFIISIVVAQPALANWYAGNVRLSSYGIKAQISTPGSAPSPAIGYGTASWVSTLPSPGWVQTGWMYAPAFPQYTPAKSFTEYQNDYGYYDQELWGTQSWGTSKNYKLNYTPSGWAYYINDELKWIVGGFAYPPITVYALSEVRTSSTNQLNTWFSSVQWRNSGGSWANFDNPYWQADSPYQVYSLSYSTYCCYGP